MKERPRSEQSAKSNFFAAPGMIMKFPEPRDLSSCSRIDFTAVAHNDTDQTEMRVALFSDDFETEGPEEWQEAVP